VTRLLVLALLAGLALPSAAAARPAAAATDGLRAAASARPAAGAWSGVAAAARPEAGTWSGPPATSGTARAVVRFAVDPGSGLVQPAVRFRVARCDGRPRARRVWLGLVAIHGGRFEVVIRHDRLRLHLTGRFDSPSRAHGTLQGRLAGRCRIPRVSWRASAPLPPTDDFEEVADADLEDGEELELDDDAEPIESDEPIEIDDEP
jgi:hypothetical protein